MEIFFSYLAASGADNLGEAYIDGRTHALVFVRDRLHRRRGKIFYLGKPDKVRTLIQTQLYAQYPNLEIHEVDLKDDYASKINFDMEKYQMYGVQYKFAQPDPYPIKTYIDYGLDQDPKDEYKIDPLTAVLEFFGSIQPGEHLWMQILVQKHEKEDWTHGVLKREARDIRQEHKDAR